MIQHFGNEVDLKNVKNLKEVINFDVPIYGLKEQLRSEERRVGKECM